jgi:hypothetical protein
MSDRNAKVAAMVRTLMAQGIAADAAAAAAELSIPRGLADLVGTMGLPVGRALPAVYPFAVESLVIENDSFFEGFVKAGTSKRKQVYCVVSRNAEKRTSTVLARDAKADEVS